MSLSPIGLVLLDTVMQRGGVIEVRVVKLDFTHVQTVGGSDVTVSVNVGVRGQPVGDSNTTEILESLRQATASDIVVVDLEAGQAWWETAVQIERFFQNDDEYLALTQQGRYEGLVSQLMVLDEFVRSIVEQRHD